MVMDKLLLFFFFLFKRIIFIIIIKPRCGHTMNLIDDNSAVCFGGIKEITHELNDLYLLKLTNFTWFI